MSKDSSNVLGKQTTRIKAGMNEYLAFVSGKDLGGAGAHDDEGDEEGDEQHLGIRMWVSFFIFKHPKFGSKARVVNPKASKLVSH